VRSVVAVLLRLLLLLGLFFSWRTLAVEDGKART
jgi:hypothetical protein